MSPKILILCVACIAGPVGFVCLQHPELMGDAFETDPSKGHLIYFTLPGG